MCPFPSLLLIISHLSLPFPPFSSPSLSLSPSLCPPALDQFLSFLEGIESDATIFEIYASSSPSEDSASIRVGEIKLAGTPFARSKFGDESLFFRHQYME